MTKAQAIARGFDRSQVWGKWLTPRCSQCEAVVINGVACHETGCPRETHECRGCSEQIPVRQRYCADCQ